MKKLTLLLLIFPLFSAIYAGSAAKTGDLQFVANNGQWQPNIRFSTALYGGTLFLENNSFTYNFSNGSDLAEFKHGGNPEDLANFIYKTHAFRTTFQGANVNVQPQGESRFDNYYNFFQGNNPANWKGKVPAFGAVRYPELYPGTDLLVYSRSNSMKYDFIVQAGADINAIRLVYDGLDGMKVEDGNLILTTSINTIMELHPVAWQIIAGVKHPVLCNFILEDNVVSFSLPDGYNQNYDLTIDPATLIFASYSGSTSDNWGYSATYDADGNLYGAGIAFANGYPITLGAFQTTWSAGAGSYVADITISKFNPTGTTLIYSTYLGGTNEDLPYSLIVNNANELIVYGATGSNNFPITAGAYDASFNGGTAATVDFVLNFSNGSDAYITKFSEDGSSLIGSTYLGGTGNDALNTAVTGYNYGDHARGEVIVDADNNICIASCTYSTNLPTTVGAFQASLGGQQDGFVARLNSNLTNLQWSSYIGGSGDDGAYSIKQMNGPDYVICGGTSSNNFPTSVGALNETYQGGSTDGFVTIISNTANTIVNSTYIGTNAYDQTFLIEVDDANAIFITGQTRGAYPVVGAVYEQPGSSQYITKLDSTLSTINFSTVFGSGTSQVNISPTAFLVDNCQNIYVCGWGGAVNQGFNFETGSVSGMEVTPDAFQSTTDGSDFYLVVFSPNMESLLYATYFGGPISDEHVDGGTSRFDKQGVVYHAVCAGCGGSDDFPTTEGVVSNTNNAPNCNLGVFKFALPAPSTIASFSADPTSGCFPIDVSLDNNSTNAAGYIWDFGDGSTSTAENPSHTYATPGTYIVSLVAIVDGDCGENDTTFTTIEVYPYPDAGFTYTPEVPSVFNSVNFTETSTDETTWFWEFGDGTTATEANPVHFYPFSGAFEVCLTVTNEYGCTDKICDSIIIDEISLLEVPNAFSPNGDQVNDVFIPLNYGLSNYEFRVYNRWGEIVFITNSTTAGWDGYFEGQLQDIGTYVYVVSGLGVDNVNYFKQGNFTLVL